MKFAADRPYTDSEKAERVLATVRCRPAHAIRGRRPIAKWRGALAAAGGLRNGSQRRSSYGGAGLDRSVQPGDGGYRLRPPWWKRTKQAFWQFLAPFNLVFMGGGSNIWALSTGDERGF